MEDIKVSILCPSYNHERFVCKFIESVLSQTEQEFELIIVDDCSTDNNLAEIKKFNDRRIKLIQHEFNQGINAGLNSAASIARGKYCVFIASDDLLFPDHLEKSISYLEQHNDVGIFYCSLLDIDNDDNPQTIQNHLYTNQDRYTILKKLFFEGNVLASPGMVVRTSIFKQILPLPLGMCQCQDYQMHVKLLLLSECFISDIQLVRYRIDYSNNNISAPTECAKLRYTYELHEVLNSFLLIDSIDKIKLIFQDIPKNILLSNSIEYILGSLAITSNNCELKRWGYNVIISYVSEKENFVFLNKNIGFTFGAYLNLSAKLIVKRNFFMFLKEKKLMVSLLLNFTLLFFLTLKIIF